MRISTQRFFKTLRVVVLAMLVSIVPLAGAITAQGQEVVKPHVVKGTVLD